MALARWLAGVLAAGMAALPPLAAAQSAPLVLDQRCQPMAAQQPDRSADQAQVAFRQRLGTTTAPFWLLMGRFGDGAVLFCLSDGPKKGGAPLALASLQYRFISEIRPAAEPNAVLITVRHGNGRRVPLTLYRLHFSTRTQFSLTPLRRWQE